MSDLAARVPPHRLYYLHNFQRALAWICARSGDVLSVEEQQFVAQFDALPQPAQALLVRLLMRRGPWFAAAQLSYDEIGDIAAAAAPLLALQWLRSDVPMALQELFDLHTKPELLQLLAAPLQQGLLHPRQRKAEMLACLVGDGHWAQPRPYAQWGPHAPGYVVWRVMLGPLCERLRLLFFGNLHQDWSEFVLADLGIFQYEPVAFDASARAFHSRADVDFYLQLHAERTALAALTSPEALQPALAAGIARCIALPAPHHNPWLARRRARVLQQLGQCAERLHDWALAAQAYGASDYPGSRWRLLRMWEHLGQYAPALALAEQAQQHPESEEESQRLARMRPRLLRALGQPQPARPRSAVAQLEQQLRCDLTLVHPGPRPDGRLPSVEYVLRDHWHRADAPVFYVENALINSLLGLLCWPAVFAPLPGAFFHPFQSGPADFSQPDFAQRRAALFDASLAALDDGSWRDTIRQRYADKYGTSNPLVYWGTLTPQLLELALTCIPAAHLRLFFARLLRDVKAHRTGFPDLVRFWPQAPEGERYALVEVKAPGDKLQDNQVRWLSYCLAQGLPVSVCHVHWHSAPADAATAPPTQPFHD